MTADGESVADKSRDVLAGDDSTFAVLDYAAEIGRRFLETVDDHLVRKPGADEAALAFDGPLPERGDGALAALREIAEQGLDAAIRSPGPRFFHFVIGGATPAALGADWLTSALDQNGGAWASSPLAAQLEAQSINWLRDMFGLPESWGGVLTTGATMANLVGLACARRWWGRRHEVDVDADGLSSLPPPAVFSSGYIHPSATKALAMLGMGRRRVQVFGDGVGRLEPAALESALRAQDGAPAIVVANAGEVNAGDFDPIADMADLCERYGAWLHVDGAFGLFAALSPQTAHLVAGLERAHSVIADGHKWLNVPYDSGFAFVRDASALPKIFSLAAHYLPDPADPRPSWMNLGPESSQRARGIAVWATLRAYGRAAYRAMVERHLALAQRLAGLVDGAPDLERLADVKLNIVCFRYRPPGLDDIAVDDLNRRLGKAVLADGRVYVGTTVYGGKTAFRPAIVNWRTKEDDVDLLVAVIRELGARLRPG